MEKRRELKPDEIKQIDPDYIKGLKFHYAEKKMVEKDGKMTWEYKPLERALKPEDVIGSRDYGDRIVIVTADGQKLELYKKKKGD